MGTDGANIRIIIDNTNFFGKKNHPKMDFFDIFIFNNVKLSLVKEFCQPYKVVFKVKVIPL